MNYIRTLLFYILFVAASFFYALTLFFMRFSYKFTIFVTKIWIGSFVWLTKYVLNIKIVIQNEHLAKTKNIVIASNHCSMWETFFLSHYFNIPVFILKKSLLKMPLFGTALFRTGMIGIDRNSLTKGHFAKITQTINTAIQQKRKVIIFPQGTRVPLEETFNYAKYPFKSGVSAFFTGQNVLTVSLDARQCFGKSLYSLKKSGTINIIFNEVIYLDTSYSREEISQKIQSSIESGCKKIIKI